MATANLLTQMTNSIAEDPGDGIVVSQPFSVREFSLASTGATLTTTITTNPGFDKFDTNVTGLTWDAGVVVKPSVTFGVPRDYDEAADHLKLRFLAKSAGETDTPTIDATAYSSADGTTDLDPTISAALSDTLAWVEIDLSGNSLTNGTSVEVQPFPSAHSTDAVEVYAVEWEYKSSIVASNQSDRA